MPRGEEHDPKDMNMDELLSRARAYAMDWRNTHRAMEQAGKMETMADSTIMHRLGIKYP